MEERRKQHTAHCAAPTHQRNPSNSNSNDTNRHSGSSNAATVAAEYILVELEDFQEKDELLTVDG